MSTIVGKASAASLDFEPPDESLSPIEGSESLSPLKLEAAERLAFHRARRERALPRQAPSFDITPEPESRAARIAATVAQRYAHSQSYHAFLAAEAERAQAQAAALATARAAEVDIDVPQPLLSEAAGPNQAVEGELFPPEHAELRETPPAAPVLTVRLYEEMSHEIHQGMPNAVPHDLLSEEDRLALDAEISFRQAPIFEEPQEPATPLPANLIEFPRQLFATRKARPRIAEGPLREESALATEASQLRIFEVEPEHISTAVLPELEAAMPEWSSIRLSACVVAEDRPSAEYDLHQSSSAVLHTASLALRLMSASVDGCIIAASFLASITIAARIATQLPRGIEALIAAGAALAALATLTALYYLLFFTLAEATPGMRYARIGLCTFSDDNPTRAAMRGRLAAVLLAAFPLGLGLLWAFVDEEGLGWHDRLSRMYQRSY